MDNIKYTRPRTGQVAHVLARIQTPPLPLQASLGILLQVSTLSPSPYRLFLSCLRTCIHTVSRECGTSQDGPHGHAQQPRLTRKSNFLYHRSYTLLMDGNISYLHS